MSINHNYYPSELNHSLRWHNRDMETLPESFINQKEALFEKSLTPSDVGKLNRLVIPKQHAEKHFPLAGSSGAAGGEGDSSSPAVEKGLVLGFEDESGKCWKFRYSYWNSSQSYVLTKGWSRYVKEKQLDAGDVVFFLRQRSDGNRLFIGCRKRVVEATSYLGSQDYSLANTTSFSAGSSGGMGPYHHHYQIPHCHESSYANPLSLPESSLSGGTISQTPPAAISKTLRLFGVNMECQLDDDHNSPPSTSGGGGDQPAGFYNHHHYPPPYYMNIAFTGDVNEMGNRRG